MWSFSTIRCAAPSSIVNAVEAIARRTPLGVIETAMPLRVAASISTES
jgi:hypothetical protein